MSTFYGVFYFYDDRLTELVEAFELAEDAGAESDRLNAKLTKIDGNHDRSCYYAVTRLMVAPPDGWYTFGTHIDYGGRIEFTKQLDSDGDPLGERPV